MMPRSQMAVVQGGYDALRVSLTNRVRAALNRNPVACYLPHRNDDTYSIDPISGRVWTAETITNLCTNGGFTTNTTGWTTGGTNTIASGTSTVPMFGTKSCLFTYSNNTTYLSFAITLTATTYICSCWVYLPGGVTGFDGQAITLTDNGSFVGATVVTGAVDMTITDRWQRVQCSITPVGGDLAGTLVLLGSGTAPTAGRTFQVDGVQIQLGSTPTPYIETDGGTATATGQMSPTMQPQGKGTARIYDGLSRYMTTPDTADMSFVEPKTFSILTVANITSAATSRDLITKAASGQNEWFFLIVSTDTSRILLTNPAATIQGWDSSNAAVAMGTFHVLGSSYNGVVASPPTGIVLYQDGAALAATAGNVGVYAGMTDGTAAVNVGAQSAGTANFMLGSIAFILVLPANLSAAQHLAAKNLLASYFGLAV